MTSETNDSPRASKIRTILELPQRLYVIGDIHGCLLELSVLLDYLRKTEGIGQSDLILFIGDYIDRGPFSKETVDALISLKTEFPKTVFLKGNHEDMLLAYLGFGGRGAEVYMHNGGLETFRNYGIQPYGDRSKIVDQFPSAHKDFYLSLETGVEIAEFLFVHAGIDPTKSIDQQSEDDLLWIRRPFVENKHTAKKTVVFGHTPFEDVLLDLPYKIGIDTGLVYGNRLSCVELVSGKLLQVEFDAKTVNTSSLEDRLAAPR